MNHIKLYSNGTGVFERAYILTEGKPLTLSLPIRNDSLDEVIASIGVFGNVTLTSPPSYTPIGVNSTNLHIDAANVIRDLATRLRGARVTVRSGAESVTGRLAGIQEFNEAVGDSVVNRYRIALFDDTGALRSFADREILTLQFTDPEVQAEIDKALQRAFETIKPNSTFVNLTITPNSEEETAAVVQYAVAQLGAWKISYRLRGQGSEWSLEGQAVVDNSTEEPWDNCLISVIAGEPISFSTDLAEIRVVRRSRVNVVADQALGSVETEDVLLTEAFALQEHASVMTPVVDLPTLHKTQPSVRARYQPAAGAATPLAAGMEKAQQSEAESRDVGDAVEYTSPYPVNVGANRSGIIPLFDYDLKEPKRLLIYKPDKHISRPFRALRFRNEFQKETDQSLSKGVCTIFEEGVYVGKAILEATKPGEERTLIYALETGVNITRTVLPIESHRQRVRIANGVVVTENFQRLSTTYKIVNRRKEAFQGEIEHTRFGPDEQRIITVKSEVAEPETQVEVTELTSALRLGLELPPRSLREITVVQTMVRESTVWFGSRSFERSFDWLMGTVIMVQNPTKAAELHADPGIQNCISRQEDLDNAKRALADSELEIKEILEEQERLKGLLHAGGNEGAATEWRTTLAANERTIKERKAQLPQLRKAIQEAEEALLDALKALTLTIDESPHS